MTLNAPKIAGMSAWYIEDQINKYKNGMRGTHENDLYGKQMAPMAATLTSEDAIKDVAAYIASLSGNSSNATISGDIENGRRLYTTCGACHGKEGEGVWSVSAPRLAGQDDWYLIRQLNNFKLGMRGTHVSDAAGMQMALLSGMLKQEGSIEDVVTYINSLK